MKLVSDQLRDALHSGDVLDLEEAICAAQAILGSRQSNPREFSTVATLLPTVRTTYLRNVGTCTRYLQPLRRACRQMDAVGISKALESCHFAPSEVKRNMQADLRKAQEILEQACKAQRDVLPLLDCEDWRRIDRFLYSHAPVLEDRTVLALVQKRQSLQNAGGESPRRTRRRTPPRLPSSRFGSVTRRDPVAEFMNVPGTTMVSSLSRTARQNNGVQRSPGHSDRNSYRTLWEEEPEGDYRATSRAWMKRSPWEVNAAALRDQARDGVVRDEGANRRTLLAQEHSNRVEIYVNEMNEKACSLCPLFSSANTGGACDMMLEPPRFQPGSVTKEVMADISAALEENDIQDSRVTRSATFPADLQEAANHGGSRRSDRAVSPPAEKRASSVALGTSRPAECSALTDAPYRLSDRHLCDSTPVISPIIAQSRHTSASTSLQTDRDRLSRSTTTLGMDLPVGVPLPPQGGGQFSGDSRLDPLRRSLNNAGMSTGTTHSYVHYRAEARLRAILLEEDIHRRDVEGTEDFDRSVFLLPVATRLSVARYNS